jgi:uncharacterized protein (TIGR02594 family)
MIPRHLALALNEIGVQEIPGKEDNPRISEYLREVGLPGDDEIAWCSAFVNWCLIHSGVDATRNAMARSFLNWGFNITQPRLGCIVVLNRGKNPMQGHVGFYMGHDDNLVKLLGGNQGNQVSIDSFAIHRLLGYRWHQQIGYLNV